MKKNDILLLVGLFVALIVVFSVIQAFDASVIGKNYINAAPGGGSSLDDTTPSTGSGGG